MVVIGCYCLLLLFGVLLGMIGSFQYSRALGSFPVAALAFAVGTGVTCVLGGLGNAQAPRRAYARCGLVRRVVRAGHGHAWAAAS